ncbi:MAG: VanZ family protein [Cyanobacteria bacterium P01_E01_bin.35]
MIALLNLIRKYWISTTLFILTIITVLSLWPLANLPPVPGTDKTHHLIAYAGLMLPLAISEPKSLRLLVISLFFVGYSGVIEILQPYINRYGEFQDLLANCAGLGCGWLIAQIINRFFPTNSHLK